MTTVSLAVGGMLVLAMAGISWYGARTLPADARIPVHYGLGSYNNFRSKTAGLITWPAAGAVVYGLYAGLVAGVVRPDHADSEPGLLIIMLVLLAVILVAQWGAISVARKRGPGGRGPLPGKVA